MDLIVVRYPSDRVSLGAALARGERIAWQADTLLYFHRDLRTAISETGQYSGSWALTPLSAADRPLIGQLVASVFDGYSNHYSANPLLDPLVVRQGYAEWAQTLLDPERGGRVLTLQGVEHDVPIAFCALNITGLTAEVALAGVLPSARGQGVYARLLLALQNWLADLGVQELIISTQASNATVIRRWIECGLQFRMGLNTIHAVLPASWEKMAAKLGPSAISCE